MLYGAVGKVGLRAFAAPFSPAQLFASGEIGAWYDPSDLTTMFQDSAGTTPVTAVGQAVGLILDKSQGLALGSEVIPATALTTGAYWNSNVGVTFPGTTAVFDADLDRVSQSAAVTTGRWYKFLVTVSAQSGAAKLQIDNNGASGYLTGLTPVGTYTGYFLAVSNGLRLLQSGAGGLTVSAFSVVEIAGNHASQSTSTSRPTLSSRVNLLTYSEQFDNAAWTKVNTTVAANAAVAPNNTTTADKLIPSTVSNNKAANGSPNYTAAVGEGVTHSCYVKADGYSKVALRESASTGAYASFDLSTETLIETGNAGSIVVSNASISSEGNGWYRISMRCTNTVGSQVNGIGVWPLSPSYTTGQPSGQNWTGNGTSGILVWGADLRPANQVNAGMPNYQRIAAATDYDTSGFPYYLSFDGTDDFLVTGTINPGSADKAQVFAGVRKLSDAAYGCIAELSVNNDSNNGSFAIFAPNLARYDIRLKGSGLYGSYNPATYTAPISSVLALLGDLSGAALADKLIPRVNGVVEQENATAGTIGTGDFSSYPLYIGRRAGTTLPFNGNIYSLIFRFSATNLDASVISQVEAWVNSKTGAY